MTQSNRSCFDNDTVISFRSQLMKSHDLRKIGLRGSEYDGKSVVERTGKITNSQYERAGNTGLLVWTNGKLYDSASQFDKSLQLSTQCLLAKELSHAVSLTECSVDSVSDQSCDNTDNNKKSKFEEYDICMHTKLFKDLFPKSHQIFEIRIKALCLRSFGGASLEAWYNVCKVLQKGANEKLNASVQRAGIIFQITTPQEELLEMQYNLIDTLQTNVKATKLAAFGNSSFRIVLNIDRPIYIPLVDPVTLQATDENYVYIVEHDVLVTSNKAEIIAAGRIEVPFVVEENKWKLPDEELYCVNEINSSRKGYVNHSTTLYKGDYMIPDMENLSPGEEQKLLFDSVGVLYFQYRQSMSYEKFSNIQAEKSKQWNISSFVQPTVVMSKNKSLTQIPLMNSSGIGKYMGDTNPGTQFGLPGKTRVTLGASSMMTALSTKHQSNNTGAMPLPKYNNKKEKMQPNIRTVYENEELGESGFSKLDTRTVGTVSTLLESNGAIVPNFANLKTRNNSMNIQIATNDTACLYDETIRPSLSSQTGVSTKEPCSEGVNESRFTQPFGTITKAKTLSTSSVLPRNSETISNAFSSTSGTSTCEGMGTSASVKSTSTFNKYNSTNLTSASKINPKASNIHNETLLKATNNTSGASSFVETDATKLVSQHLNTLEKTKSINSTNSASFAKLSSSGFGTYITESSIFPSKNK